VPVQLQFSNDKRYLIYEISDPVDVLELLETYKQERAYRDSVTHTVHSIVDLSKVRQIPKNWLAVRSGPGLTHARSGSMLLVGVSPGLQIIMKTILQIARYDRMRFFATRAQAEAHMQQILAKEQAKV
jgi:hypothetical protein